MSDSQVQHCVITHGNCRDGFVASLCAKYYYSKVKPQKNIIYWEVDPSYQLENLVKLFDQCLYNANSKKGETQQRWSFLSFDVSFVPDTIKTFLANYGSKGVKIDHFYIYDHHKTALDAWSKLTDSHSTYTVDFTGTNMSFHGSLDECGASLAWNYYFHGAKPKFIEYVKDRDNWLFDTPAAVARNSWDVNEYLMATAPPSEDTERWFDYFRMEPEKEPEFYENAGKMGKLLTEMKNKQLYALSASGGVRYLNNEQRAFVCNCTLLQSDVGNYVVNLKSGNGPTMLSMDKSIPVVNKGEYLCDWALLWRYDEKDKVYHVSLRSRKGGVDVSAIARKFGGGGHAAASGFKCANIFEALATLVQV